MNERTERQLAQLDPEDAARFVPGTECPACGALPGFTHSDMCTSEEAQSDRVVGELVRMYREAQNSASVFSPDQVVLMAEALDLDASTIEDQLYEDGIDESSSIHRPSNHP
jgi:hypothetical protein